ncbi:MAG: hypothetical protein L0Y60_13150 [Beijerinckiaceae bacterium]|nr:hypothetical protein [Beijerinckiaceae bacterium]
MDVTTISVLTVVMFASVGLWLEGIGDKSDLLDEFFTPVPMALSGVLYAFAARIV